MKFKLKIKIKIIIIITSLVLIFLGVIGCASMSKATKTLTPREEYYLGRSVAANAFAQLPFIDTKFNEYLNTVGQYLSYFSDRPHTYIGHHFGVINSDRPLAYSSPGGHILISSAMIRTLENEDELAAVLAHEIGHIEHQHALKTIRKSGISEMGINTGLALLSFFTKNQELHRAMEHYDELVSDYAEQVINGSYSKSQEKESDQSALKILSSTGYDASALHSYLLRVKTEGGGWLSNHPSDEERVKLVEKQSNFDKNFLKRKKRFEQMKKMLK